MVIEISYPKLWTSHGALFKLTLKNGNWSITQLQTYQDNAIYLHRAAAKKPMVTLEELQKSKSQAGESVLRTNISTSQI